MTTLSHPPHTRPDAAHPSTPGNPTPSAWRWVLSAVVGGVATGGDRWTSKLSPMDRPRLVNRRSVLGLGAAAAATLVTPGCSRGKSAEPAPAEPGRFATGNAGGVYAAYGAGLARL